MLHFAQTLARRERRKLAMGEKAKPEKTGAVAVAANFFGKIADCKWGWS
jgi:hypothetical protein